MIDLSTFGLIVGILVLSVSFATGDVLWVCIGTILAMACFYKVIEDANEKAYGKKEKK